MNTEDTQNQASYEGAENDTADDNTLSIEEQKTADLQHFLNSLRDSTFSYNEALYIIDNLGQKGDSEHESVQTPFMTQNPKQYDDANQEHKDKIGIKTGLANQILEQLPAMPRGLKYLYQIIGDPACEFYFKHWTLFSLNNVLKRYNLFVEAEQTRVIDFAVRYAGMGHCIVCAYDTQDKRIFYRADGGSSGWDREANWKWIIKYEPKDDDKLDFTHLIKETVNLYEAPWHPFESLPIANKDM